MPTGVWKRTKKHKIAIKKAMNRKEVKLKISQGCSGSKSGMWKGDNAGSVSLHQWLISHYGKAKRCENPNCNRKCRKYDWANKKKHKYTRNIKDYQQLCKSCHQRYDKGTLLLKEVKGGFNDK